MIELKPCPFCGGAAHFFKINDLDEKNFGGEGICCGSCPITTDLMFSLMEDCKPKLAEAWNRRAQPAQAVPLLTDVEISLMAHNADDGDWNALGFKESWHEGFFSGARAVEQEVRAKMGAGVPMTDPQLQTSEERRATGERIASMLRVEEVGADLLRRARTIVVGRQRGSISLVQRQLRISYNTAAKLLEALEQEGVVSPQRQNGQREVLVLPDISGIVGKEGA